MSGEKLIVLFDGVCNFCNGWVQLILRNDKKDEFLFAALQSDAGKRLLSDSNLSSPPPESVIVIEKGKYHFHSSAALRISSRMGGLWKLMVVFYILPRPIRDGLYSIIARNRYKWFGRKDTCMVPDEKVRNKFL